MKIKPFSFLSLCIILVSGSCMLTDGKHAGIPGKVRRRIYMKAPLADFVRANAFKRSIQYRDSGRNMIEVLYDQQGRPILSNSYFRLRSHDIESYSGMIGKPDTAFTISSTLSGNTRTSGSLCCADPFILTFETR